MQQFLKWLGTRLFPREAAPDPALRQTGVRVRPHSERPQAAGRHAAPAQTSGPRPVRLKTDVNGKIADGGPGKNVLIRNRFVREDSGTHDTLKILDESLHESQEECGIDPYNTGRFDRSKSWEFRSRK